LNLSETKCYLKSIDISEETRKNLTDVDLSGNDFTKLPDLLLTLTNITRLNLSKNNVSFLNQFGILTNFNFIYQSLPIHYSLKIYRQHGQKFALLIFRKTCFMYFHYLFVN